MIKLDVQCDTEGLARKLDEFAARIHGEVAFSGVAAMARVLHAEARAQVPVMTGQLSAAIYRKYSPELSTETTKVYRISWNRSKAPHGHLVEFGTSRAPAHPFIRPAFDRIDEAIQAGKERMAERIDEVKGEL
jgi:HK97 gp10 family phage protein